mmetsp:Transcript_20426/g.53643  ORF Transcript_20426/g.53643 Transcript_20426/m.53643 type:complete len:209 (-) Transcript_20426:3-629(-)
MHADRAVTQLLGQAERRERVTLLHMDLRLYSTGAQQTLLGDDRAGTVCTTIGPAVVPRQNAELPVLPEQGQSIICLEDLVTQGKLLEEQLQVHTRDKRVKLARHPVIVDALLPQSREKLHEVVALQLSRERRSALRIPMRPQDLRAHHRSGGDPTDTDPLVKPVEQRASLLHAPGQLLEAAAGGLRPPGAELEGGELRRLLCELQASC